MDNSMYNSMISANHLLEKQAIISNNLANISTTGFKEKFNYMLQKNQNTKDFYSTNNITIKEYYNFSPGTLNYTERNLDLFVKENGWLTVKDSKNQEAYTKNGHLKVNSKGKLTIQDNEIIGNNCNITIPNNIDLKISSHGVITTVEKKNNSIVKTKIGELKLVMLPKQDLIEKENGLFYLKQGNQLNKHNKNVRVQSRMLESSNVNPSKNMIEMISNARQFEMQMKMISICDKNAEYANQLINVNN